MADHYWIWSHAFKIRSDETADPLKHRFSRDQLNAMTDMEHMAAFIGRWKDDDDAEHFSVERMAYIIEHALEYERVEIAHVLEGRGNETFLMPVQYVRAKMAAARAVEFKMRFFAFTPQFG